MIYSFCLHLLSLQSHMYSSEKIGLYVHRKRAIQSLTASVSLHLIIAFRYYMGLLSRLDLHVVAFSLKCIWESEGASFYSDLLKILTKTDLIFNVHRLQKKLEVFELRD